MKIMTFIWALFLPVIFNGAIAVFGIAVLSWTDVVNYPIIADNIMLYGWICLIAFLATKPLFYGE